MEGIFKTTRDGFFPKCLLVKMKLTCNKQSKNDPETCQRHLGLGRHQEEITKGHEGNPCGASKKRHHEWVRFKHTLSSSLMTSSYLSHNTLFILANKRKTFINCVKNRTNATLLAQCNVSFAKCKTKPFSTPSATKPDHSDLDRSSTSKRRQSVRMRIRHSIASDRDNHVV